MVRWIPLFLAAIPTWSGAVDLSTILSSLSRSGIPDTAEYRLTTTFQVVDRPMTTSMKIVQKGKDLHWSEATVGGRTLRIVRNGLRQRVLDLGSGESHTILAPVVETPLATDWRQLAQASWSEPVDLMNGSWRIRQLSGLDSGVAGRLVEWSENDQLPSAMIQWDGKGDTTFARVRWTRIGERSVPSQIEVESGRRPASTIVSLRFTDWRFPRSIPDAFFAIP